jgi:ribosome assembly protein 1
VPILRVAVEPQDLMEMEKLREGLKLLNVAYPCVEIMDTATGELVLGACGEVHLEKCLDDLENIYSKIKVVRSAPIVPFRETLIEPPKVDELGESFGQQQKNFMKKFIEMENRGQILEDDENDREEIDQASGSVMLYTINRQARIKVQAFPLPTCVRLFLETRSEDLRSIHIGKASKEFNDHIRSSLMDVFHKAGFAKSSATVDQIIAFGPEGFGPNILLNMVEVLYRSDI